jgi:hypothetical protein
VLRRRNQTTRIQKHSLRYIPWPLAVREAVEEPNRRAEVVEVLPHSAAAEETPTGLADQASPTLQLLARLRTIADTFAYS